MKDAGGLPIGCALPLVIVVFVMIIASGALKGMEYCPKFGIGHYS
jgi:hypothetical protein